MFINLLELVEMKHNEEGIATQDQNSELFSFPNLFDPMSQNIPQQQFLMSPMPDQLSSQFSPHLMYYSEFPQEQDVNQVYSFDVLPQSEPVNVNKKSKLSEDSDPSLNMSELDLAGMSPAEIKRQIHIQSEQKRRAQIRDGFEELRTLLPSFNSTKQPSKAAILARTVMHLKHLSATQNNLLMEIERLRLENYQLQYNMPSPPTSDQKMFNSMYSFGV